MVDFKNAYRVLGLSEGAGIEEIEKKYEVLVKRHRANTLGENTGADSEINIYEINNAYKLLMDFEEAKTTNDQSEPESNKVLNKVIRKVGMNESKVSNFFYYNKYRIIIAVFLLVALFFTVREFTNRVTPDFSIMFYGQIEHIDSDFVENIKKNVPSIKEPRLKDANYAGVEGLSAFLASREIDVFIFDRQMFGIYANNGSLTSLDELTDELKIDREKNRDYALKREGASEEHLYGINITGSKLLGRAVAGDELIVSIAVNAKHRDKAVEFIKQVLKE